MIYNTWACFECRKTYNREHSKRPSCEGKLHSMGKYFKAPSQKNDKEWEAIEILHQAGIRYASGAVDLRYNLIEKYKNATEPISKSDLINLLWNASYYYQALSQKQLIGAKPGHPRTAREYLATIETRKQDLFWLVQTLVNRLGRNHPESKKGASKAS